MSNYLSQEKINEIFDRLLDGQSIRSVAGHVSASTNTVKRYKDALKWLALNGEKGCELKDCPCGKSAGHKGWCSHRYTQSALRQKFMKEWHQKRI